MRTAVDTNVLSAIWSKESGAEQLIRMLGDAGDRGAILICGAVLAEALAHPKVDAAFVYEFLRDTGIRIDANTNEPLWREAGLRYARQVRRRRKSAKEVFKRVLADYIVGAHAMQSADCLMTLDKNRYRTDFPELKLV